MNFGNKSLKKAQDNYYIKKQRRSFLVAHSCYQKGQRCLLQIFGLPIIQKPRDVRFGIWMEKNMNMSIMGIGANILGYADDDVDNAVIEAINKSVSSTLNCQKKLSWQNY